jgi:hypothetical protein
MTNYVNQENVHYDDKPKNDGLITKARNAVKKTIGHSSSLVVLGSLSLGGVIIFGLWVIWSSECGGSLSYKSSPSSQEFLFKKESCRQPNTTTQVQQP